ncbi:MAG TPA: DUF4129 domain-containing protein, partial [Bdellovibrionota bacterium]|nr:DUF4129 domain-containing protein [Bdellovibrionota bacterium]
TPFLVLLAAVAIYLFRRKLKKQADPAKVNRSQLAREQRAEILHALREITRRKLSPREEIIARYDLFCRIMEMARTPREPSLPPTDFHRRIGYLHPKIEGGSKRITESFCDTFYGELDVAEERLRDCRSAVKDVFHHFAD